MLRASKPTRGFPVTLAPWHLGTLAPFHLVTLSFLLAIGCDLPGQPKRADQPVPEEQVSNFDALYARHCAGCHGADGKLGPAPPLNDPNFLAMVPDEELSRVIREGRAVTPSQNSPMPAFALSRGSLTAAQTKAWNEVKVDAHADPQQRSPLTAEQIKNLAAGIKQHWGAAAPSSWSGPLYLAPKGAAGKPSDGAKAFARACAGCHGSDGKDENAINDQAFLALISDQALRRIIITGRPDLGMPDYKGKAGRDDKFEPLNGDEITNLVALLAEWRKGGTASGK